MHPKVAADVTQSGGSERMGMRSDDGEVSFQERGERTKGKEGSCVILLSFFSWTEKG